MDEPGWLADQFEKSRGRLRAVAYRMLGSASEADDAVQEGWIRLGRTDVSEVENLRAWLTTVVARVCLDMLRSRRSRREEPLEDENRQAIAERRGATDPEQETLLADSLGVALLVVLDRLGPAERVAFVLHDMFGTPFEEIAQILGRSVPGARQLASRARHRVRGADPHLGADRRRQREVVDAFLAALGRGDLEGLLAVLDPDVAIHVDDAAARPGAPREIRGARAWAGGAIASSRAFADVRSVAALVEGSVGIVAARRGRVFRVLKIAFRHGRIAEVEIIGDPARLQQMTVEVLAPPDRLKAGGGDVAE